MLPAIKTNSAARIDDAQGRQPKRVALPTHTRNPLLVNGAESSNPALVEAFKSIRTQIMKPHLSSDVRSFVVTSAAQADGKTMTAFNLACSFAKLEEISILLVDADLRTQGLSKLVGNVRDIGLRDFLTGAAECDEIVNKSNLGDLWIAGAGHNTSVSPAELFSSVRWLQFILWAKKHFKIVLLDSPPISAVADFDLISSACDGIVLVVRALKTPREILEESLRQIDTKKLLGVVWNSSPKARNYCYR